MKYGICNEIFRDWPWDKIVRSVSDLGYNGIEIAPFTLADSAGRVSPGKRKSLVRLAQEHNLEIIGLHWLLKSPSGLSLSSPEPQVRKRTVNRLKELIGLCADLGGKIMVFGSPEQRAIFPGTSRETVYGYLRDSFAEILPRAAENGVVIALEPLARKETNFVNTAAEAIAMIKDLNHPNFLLHLDVKAMSDEEKSVPEIIAAADGLLAHFHANDPNLLGPGFGVVNYRPIKAALADIHYQGYLSVEVFDFRLPPETVAGESINYLKGIFED